jgi:hypothetical protein
VLAAMNQITSLSAYIENDVERDRKTCVALDLKVSGANRELAQWLMEHPRYFPQVIAQWLGCSDKRIQRLRAWAKGGFVGGPYDKSNAARNERTSTSTSPLKSQENSNAPIADEAAAENGSEPQEDNGGFILAIVGNAAKAATTAARNLHHDLTPEEKSAIVEAIGRMIKRWESVSRKLN